MSGLAKSKQRFVRNLLEWHENNRRDFPWRLKRTPFRVFVAEFFLQRTPVERVSKVYEKFISEYPTIKDIAQADPDKLASDYHELGLTKRFGWMVDSAAMIRNKHDGIIPENYNELLMLPGIGEYTASAVMCFAFDCDLPIVDTNVLRVLYRVFKIRRAIKNDDYALASSIMRFVSKGGSRAYNEALLDFALNVCRNKPLHSACPLVSLCAYYKQNYITTNDL